MLVLLAVAAAHGLTAQTRVSFSANFVRTRTAGSAVEVTRGVLYAVPPDEVCLVVTEPVSQWVIFERARMTIYYPDENKAFRFTAKLKGAPAFSQVFLGIVKDDFGLSEAGFKLASSEQLGDTLRTVWKPPDSLGRTIKRAILENRSGLPSSLEMLDGKGSLVVRTSFEDYVSVGASQVPSRATIVQVAKGAQVSEEVTYSGHVVDPVLPDGLADFHLPKGVSLQEFQW
jgi:outer membrane lipoprotein-sorting protein